MHSAGLVDSMRENQIQCSLLGNYICVPARGPLYAKAGAKTCASLAGRGLRSLPANTLT